ncbi:hypothetical protein CHS0354_003368 [Potamilus streckersoni]|uniref:Uncharacterized protein n=1 Tax=Potamilus streckersoni TaxID=2493646 RepID=A0AAE0W194_9BIVA|nr:hypothetical protein CHS0354_003368 [Potamilus streckersoni]
MLSDYKFIDSRSQRFLLLWKKKQEIVYYMCMNVKYRRVNEYMLFCLSTLQTWQLTKQGKCQVFGEVFSDVIGIDECKCSFKFASSNKSSSWVCKKIGLKWWMKFLTLVYSFIKL